MEASACGIIIIKMSDMNFSTVGLLAGLLSLNAVAGGNLVRNPSFEDWKDGEPLPAHWITHDRDTLKEKISRFEGAVPDGRYAAHIARGRCGNALVQRIPVVPGRYYDIFCKVKLEIPFFEFYFANHWETAEGKFVHNVTKLARRPAINGKHDWTDLGAKNLRAPDGVKYLVLVLMMNDSSSKNDVPGEVFIDSVSVTESTGVAASSEDYRPAIAVPIASAPDWNAAPTITRLVSPGSFSPEGAQTAVRLAATPKALHLRVDAERLPSTTVPKAKGERDHAAISDIVEVFLKPDPAVDRQYHFIFDSAGNVWDAYQTFITNRVLPKGVWLRSKNFSDWNAKGLVSSVREAGKGWALDCEIPWADLGMTSPRPEARILANFCRGDYGATGSSSNQLTEWALQQRAEFADWRDWGVLEFSEGLAAVRNAEILPGSSAVSVEVAAGARDRDIRVVVEEVAEDGTRVRLGEGTERVPARGTRTVGVTLGTKAAVAWISVFDGDRLIYRRGGRAAGKMFEIGLRDPLNVRKRHIKIPNDTRWPNIFRITHTLTGKTGHKNYDNTPELGVRLFAEVPEGVAIPQMMYSVYGGDMPVLKPIASEPMTRGGKAWTKYELPVRISGVHRPMIFLTSTLPAGTRGSVYLYLTWNGGAQIPTEFPFEVVSFGRVEPFERMQFRLDDMTYNYAHAICDDPAKELPTLGVNILKVPMNPKGAERTALEKWMAEIRASGRFWRFSIQNELNDALRFWCNRETWGNPLKLEPDESGAYRDIDGRLVRNSFGWHSPCLMYRGVNYRKQVDGILACEAVRKYGVDWLVLDWEFWREDPCYCDNCVKTLWPKYLKRKGLPDYGDPRVFMRKPKEHPEAAKAWREMYASHRGLIYSDLKRDLKAKGGKDFKFSDWVFPRPHLLKGMDYFDWAFGYYGPEASISRMNEMYTNVLHGSSEKLVCSLNSMQGCEMNDQYPPISTLYNMMEAVTAGVRGFEWWYAPVLEAETWKYIMDALRAVRPYERLILDGKVTIHGEGENCIWRRVEKDGEALYCVRNYDLKGPVDAAFVHEGRRIEVKLDPAHKARLLHVDGTGSSILL